STFKRVEFPYGSSERNCIMSEPTATTATQPSQSGAVSVKEIDKYLTAAWKNNASDVHIKVGEPPLFRMRGTIVRAKMPPLMLDQVRAMFYEVMSPQNQKELDDIGG